MREPVTIEDRDKQTAEGTADIARYGSSKRLVTALGVAIGGTVLGLCTIVIPGVHFVAPWLLPLLSIGIAFYLYGRKGVCAGVQVDCPACKASIEAEGGPWEEPMWVRCPECQAPLKVIPATPLT